MHASTWTRRAAAVGVVLILGTTLAGCGRGNVASSTAAEVGGERISRDKVIDAVERALAGNPDLPRKQLSELHLTQLVRVEFFAAMARARGLSVTDEHLRATRTRLEGQTLADGGLEKAALDLGIAERDLADLIRLRTLEDRLSLQLVTERPATEAELAAVRATSGPVPEFVDLSHAAHILVREEALANTILAEIKAGGDFAALAAKHSFDGSRESGGDLGLATKGRYVAPFEQALNAAKPGEVVGPVKTEFGYHIIKAIEFVSAAESERRFREQEAIAIGRSRLVGELSRGPAVTINPRFGKWDADRLAVVTADEGEGDDAPSAPKRPAAAESPTQ